MKALDKQLLETEYLRKGNWVKLIAILKHQFNEWSTTRLVRGGHKDFKMVYMPILMNITPEGITNNDLAVHARVKGALVLVGPGLGEAGGPDALVLRRALVKRCEYVSPSRRPCLLCLGFGSFSERGAASRVVRGSAERRHSSEWTRDQANGDGNDDLDDVAVGVVTLDGGRDGA